MSYVIAAPEIMTSAATDVASIGSTLNVANAAAAARTTGVLAAAEDEVSAAIAALFGAHGQAYQAMSAQAAAFHSEFVNLMNAGAGAYLSTEITNAEQALTNAVGAPVQALVGGGASLGSGGGGAISTASGGGLLEGLLGGLLGGGGTTRDALVGGLTGGSSGLLGGLTGSTDLLTGLTGRTSGVLGGLGSLGGNLNSIVSGALPGLPTAQTSFEISLLPGLLGAGTGGTGSTDIAGPYVTLIENTIANLQSLGAGWLADPFPFLRQVIAVPGHIFQNISNVTNTLTDISITFGSQLDTSNLPLSLVNSTLTINLGLPVALGLDAIGAPITTFFAFEASGAAFGSAVQSGNFAAALTALVDAPAVIANGFLNGHATLALQQSFSTNLTIPVTDQVTVGVPVTEQASIGIPLGGVLTPLAPITAIVGPVTIGPVTVGQLSIPIPPVTVGPFPIPVPPFSIGPFTIPIPPVTVGPFTGPTETFGPFPLTVHGTPIGGIIPALVNYAPQQLAHAIGAPV
jgi:hypothetical protein